MRFLPFKRTETEFEGADVPMHASDRLGRTTWLSPQRVTIVKCYDEDDDLWTIRLAEGNSYVVEGDTLSPHPLDPELNTEFMTRVMASGSPLMEAFVVEAIAKYSEQVLAMNEDQRSRMDQSFITYEAWRYNADIYTQMLADRASNNK